MKRTLNTIVQVCAFFSILTCWSWTNLASDDIPEILPLEDYLNANKLSVDVVSLGGHREECIELTIRNLGPKSIQSYLEPGRRLLSEDTTEQDIFIVKKKTFSIPPLASITLKGYGFCCQSSNHSPKKVSTYTTGYMAPEKWVKLADTINQNQYNPGAIQSAVWSISNGHAISSIYDVNRDAIYSLLQTVASIRNEPLPWYSFTYVQDSTQLFSNDPEKFHGKVEYFLKNNAAVSIVVKNTKGRLMTHIENGHLHGHGKQTYDVDLSVKGWPKGNYEIIVVEDFWNINSVKKFTI
ncbi:MAG: hypothetical protein ACI8SE_001103 [Bacteroidia bacterium]|jgi:hypothetical protein